MKGERLSPEICCADSRCGSAVAADALADEAVGDDLRQAGAVAARDQVQHEVEGRHAAGAGDAVAVDDVELLADGDVRIVVAEHAPSLPNAG